MYSFCKYEKLLRVSFFGNLTQNYVPKLNKLSNDVNDSIMQIPFRNKQIISVAYVGMWWCIG